MLELAGVLITCSVIVIMAYEFMNFLKKREWGENYKSIF